MRLGPLRTMLALAAVAGSWALGSEAVPAQTPGPSLEYAVKATYLYKFAPFVSWRAGQPGGAADPFQICILGADPFGATLDQAVASRRVGRRPVQVRRVGAAERGMGCHVLYLGGGQPQSSEEALAALRGEPILTVTDAARGPGPHGMIHFWVQGGRVRFQIDAATASAAGLSISSKLLALNAKAPGGRP